jgi:hypothetical protein
VRVPVSASPLVKLDKHSDKVTIPICDDFEHKRLPELGRRR